MSTIIIESWCIPFDILMIIFVAFAIISSLIFLLNITLDKTCHTVSMVLVTNSCLAAFLFECDLLGIAIFTLRNDLKQTQYQDVLCTLRAYLGYCSCAALNYSFVLQSIYQYVIVIYPVRLF